MSELSLAQFSTLLMKIATSLPVAARTGLDAAAALIEQTAKDEIGHYQPAAGGFNAWAELSPVTKADRVEKGFAENEPLLRTGKLRDSISREVGELEAVVGSDSDIAIYQELGTSSIPPRAFLGPAAFRNKKKIKLIIGEAVVTGMLMGGKASPVNPAYRFKTDSGS